ncbi:hypothetical protein G7066_14600 [Leucobacter coleopterorum]|uniref:Uncharacterized protein n=1 Tax=Leucobacter coleopterorum TaxID=2714933 RepID=A0ABX6JYV1_9MICO|nr:hypothetical protein [Leucobacter coleopterorum]QIM19497.1 hypothetical protein G7066_14600 [Leucobacter coleopterorum]
MTKPITFPACEELVTQEEITAHVGDGFIFIPGQSSEDGLLQSALGPSAKAALDQAVQSSYCIWAIPQSDGSTVLLSAELPDKARDTFLAELRASDFTETEINGSPTFVWETDQHYGPRFVWYGFSGNILVTSLALSPNGEIGKIALARIKEANPST